jgi:N-acetylglucosaminyldiphosphoundecaprenol N-acetyl-beta-D-mannosaminyltransferase
MQHKIKRIRILGIPVDTVSMATACELVHEMIAANKKKNCILAVNPEKILALQKNASLRHLFEGAALLLPDGIGVVIASRLLYGEKIPRLPGADLMQRLCAEAADKKYKIFIYGSAEGVNKKAVENISGSYPGINIVGRAHGFQKEEAIDNLIHEINESGADILFIALGSPRQEEWLIQNLPRLHVGICQGIGGTLDTIAGTTKRAPVLFRKAGLEWLYRLVKEPKRIYRQSALPVFAFKVLKEKIRT